MRAWEINPEILQPPIIDIGSGRGPLKCQYSVTEWDIIRGDSDATFMRGVADESYATVYSHHLLEHLTDPITALRNWWRILQHGGHLILTVPERDLYEKRRLLPSRFNPDHKTMWLAERFDPPNTFSLTHIVRQALTTAVIVSVNTIRAGYVALPPDQQSPDGFHLELVARKP